MKINFAKYKGIIISVTIFLLIEVSILSTNYVLSFDIEADSTAVNVSGRQRMLSQRITKSLFKVELEESREKQIQYIQELRNSSLLFNNVLNAFDQGGEIPNADNTPVTLKAVSTPYEIEIVNKAKTIWSPLWQEIQTAVQSFDNNDVSFINNIASATDYATANNLQLLALMNDLTVDLESQAEVRANFLRNVQTIGITLGLLNFLIIIFIFIRQLQRSDDIALEAQKETEQILETVDEGLFLVDQDLNIGDKSSDKTTEIFSNEELHGEPLLDFLGNYISSKDKETTKEYFDLLFDKRKPVKLIGDLNPLREVSLQVPDEHLGYRKKYLKFSFSRVGDEKQIDKILTTVSDISNEVKLREELKRSEKENAEQMNILTAVLNSNQETMSSFINQSNKGLSEINEILKKESNENSDELKAKIQHLIVIMHSIKGDANALSIGTIAELAHQFESDAQDLLNKSTLEGKDFIPLIVLLEKMISYIETISSLYSRVFSQGKNSAASNSSNGEHFPAPDIRSNWKNLYQLANQVANRQDKSVEFTASGLNDYELNTQLKEYINTVAIQLIRNSINHGIESKAHRFETEKSSTGRIHLNLTKLSDNSFELTFKDDGAGIQKNKLIEKAIEANLISVKKAEQMNPKKILSLLFHPGLSTTDEVSQDSGRGVGMSLVLEKTNEIGGRINVQTSTGVGTTFKITIPSSSFSDQLDELENVSIEEQDVLI